MRRWIVFFLLLLPELAMATEVDSVWVRPRAYARGAGMGVDYSVDRQEWDSICGRLVTSDYGPWGKEKKLYNPSLTVGRDGEIALVFQVNKKDNQFAVSHTKDLIHWRPQDYPKMDGVGQCMDPVVECLEGTYHVWFHNRDGQWYETRSEDLVNFSAPEARECGVKNQEILLPYSIVEKLEEHQLAAVLQDTLYHELARDDSVRFAGLKTVDATLSIDPTQKKTISNRLMGIFFEDINYAADGGLWAELLENGDFEYDPTENNKDSHWGLLKAWTTRGVISVEEVEGVSKNNPHAVMLSVDEKNKGASLCNMGWSGIPVEKGKTYDLSMYTRGVPVRVSIVKGKRTLASVRIEAHEEWEKSVASLKMKASCDSALLEIRPLEAGSVSVDMVSLMPRDTYKGHGLRRDLAETIAALHPKFMRFPGGCLVHGNGMDNIYHWKETIGPMEERKGQYNIWHYHQSRRLGYYEFFQMCEDMGMDPLPVVSAGTPCPNSSRGGNGQQGGIPMDQMDEYVQEVLDLIEWANGDSTTTWGKKRAAQGHAEPFHLRMIGIGNEDLISPTFVERYLMLCRAVKEKWPEIEICGTAGPYYCGPDYEEGWRIAKEHHEWIDMVDEHYYLPPAWYVYNQHFYDGYDRSGPKVYLGEWAAHVPKRKSTVEIALSEALYFCNLERNGDEVVMSSYAPLLARKGHTQWNPDMIYFTGTEVSPTVGYYAHKMCGNSQGDTYVETSITTGESMHGVKERLAASTVVDSRTGHTYVKMVNLLPVEVSVRLDTHGLMDGERTCDATILSGTYNDTEARPAESVVSITEGKLILKPYSFTLLTL